MKIKFYLLRPNCKKETGLLVSEKVKAPSPTIHGNKRETGLLVSVSYKTERLRLGIDESINPKYWNVKTSRARSTPAFPQAPEFNQRLEIIKSGIEKCYYEFFNEDNQPPTKEQIKALILMNVLRKLKVLSFFDFYLQFIEDTARGARLTRKGKVVAPESSKQYRVAYSTMKEYNPKLNFNDITDKFYNNYLKFLNGKGLSINTIGDQIKKLKAVMGAAYKAGYHRNEAFKDFIKLSEPADNIYLDEQELKAIENLDLSGTPALDRVRDLFLIGAFTGLRQSDFSRLRPQHIKNGFISIDQTKTGEDVVIPVHAIVKKIIAKYNGNLPAAITGQKFNEAIKEVCKQAPCLIGNESKRRTQGGLKTISTLQKWQMISSHTCRRSFCTNQYLNGMPTLTIMAVSGHETETSFLKYIKVSKNEHAERMRVIWEKKENTLIAV